MEGTSLVDLIDYGFEPNASAGVTIFCKVCDLPPAQAVIDNLDQAVTWANEHHEECH